MMKESGMQEGNEQRTSDMTGLYFPALGVMFTA